MFKSLCVTKLRRNIKNLLYLIVVIVLSSILINANQYLDMKYSEDNLINFLNKMSNRTKRIQDVCNIKCHSGKCKRLTTGNMYWLKSENIVYCPIFKSATSTWRDHLISILNQTHPDSKKKKQKGTRVHDKLIHLGAIIPKSRDFVPYIKGLPEKHDLNGFMVVRHPFERLVSAYRDKLERNNLEEPFYYENFGKYFVEKYRKAAIKELGESYFHKENNFGTPIKVLNDRRPDAKLPSFWEFVQSVIDRYKIDEHWAPIYEFCSLCNVISMKAFRYILKFEELRNDESIFVNHVKWNLSSIGLDSKLNVNKPNDISGNEITLLYFSILSEKQIKELYKVYELDFLLFDYTFNIGDINLPPEE